MQLQNGGKLGVCMDLYASSVPLEYESVDLVGKLI